jgi:hypothetical protein
VGVLRQKSTPLVTLGTPTLFKIRDAVRSPAVANSNLNPVQIRTDWIFDADDDFLGGRLHADKIVPLVNRKRHVQHRYAVAAPSPEGR